LFLLSRFPLSLYHQPINFPLLSSSFYSFLLCISLQFQFLSSLISLLSGCCLFLVVSLLFHFFTPPTHFNPSSLASHVLYVCFSANSLFLLVSLLILSTDPFYQRINILLISHFLYFLFRPTSLFLLISPLIFFNFLVTSHSLYFCFYGNSLVYLDSLLTFQYLIPSTHQFSSTFSLPRLPCSTNPSIFLYCLLPSTLFSLVPPSFFQFLSSLIPLFCLLFLSFSISSLH
jgi:hypothetical protein